jgi:hypothetical protein
VTVSDSDVKATVHGIEAYSGTANGNTVTVSNSSVQDSVRGAEIGFETTSVSGTAEKNSVTIRDSTVGKEVIGAEIGSKTSSVSGNAANNSVTILNSTVGQDVTGAEIWSDTSSVSGNAGGNTVSVSNSRVEGGVFGADIHADVDVAGSSGSAENNSVSISDSFVGFAVVGAYSPGNASGNRVSINNSSVGEYLTSSEVRDSVIGGYSDSGNAAGNSVSISGGSTIHSTVYGGYTASGNASKNTVTVTGGKITGDVYGGYAANGNADDNTVEISGGTITGNIYGGWAKNDSAPHEALNNTVIIGGNAVVSGKIYGGYAASTIQDTSEGNRIIIYGTPTMADAQVFGGFVEGQTAAAQFTGNTLVTATDATLHLNTVENVENFEFVLPAKRGKDYVALSADTFTFGNGKEKSKVTSITVQGGGSILRQGDTLTLFQQTDGNLDIRNLNTSITGSRGMALLYRYTLSDDGLLTVSKVRANPRAKALSEGQAAGLAFLTQGSDLIADGGMRSAVSGADASRGLSAFAATSGGWSRYDTGSHVDVSGVSVIAGLALGADLPPGRLTLGAFFEGGWGSYNSFNSFSGDASVDGDGDTSYVGGGILGRLDTAPLGPGKAYVEASGRMGNSSTDFSSSDLRDEDTGAHARYDTDGTYYGLHAGIGYVWRITDAASLDLSGKYFWTHREGDIVRIDGDRFKFDSLDSHRLRAGGRFSFAATDHIVPYVGAAYEHELDGKADASTHGYSISSPDLSGATGIGELGVTLLGRQSAPLSVDLGVQGYTGVRQGVTGSLQLKLEF